MGCILYFSVCLSYFISLSAASVICWWISYRNFSRPLESSDLIHSLSVSVKRYSFFRTNNWSISISSLCRSSCSKYWIRAHNCVFRKLWIPEAYLSGAAGYVSVTPRASIPWGPSSNILGIFSQKVLVVALLFWLWEAACVSARELLNWIDRRVWCHFTVIYALRCCIALFTS